MLSIGSWQCTFCELQKAWVSTYSCFRDYPCNQNCSENFRNRGVSSIKGRVPHIFRYSVLPLNSSHWRACTSVFRQTPEGDSEEETDSAARISGQSKVQMFFLPKRIGSGHTGRPKRSP